MNLDDIVARKLRTLFPDPKKLEVALSILSQYGSESHEKEPSRVRLAILRLSGSSIAKLQQNVATAKQDFRDILTYAEYPRQADHDSWKLTAEQNAELESEDKREYEKWLMQ